MTTTYSEGTLRHAERRGSYLDLLERVRRAGAGKLKGKYAGLSWNDVYRAAEKLDERRDTERFTSAIFDRIFAVTMERIRQENEVKAKLAGRVLFVKSFPTTARVAAKKPRMTDEQLRATACRLSRL